MSQESNTIVMTNSSRQGGLDSTVNTCECEPSAQSESNSNSNGEACALPLHSIHEPACLVNYEGRVIECNAAACGLLGLKRNCLLSSVLPALAPSAISDKSKNIFADIIHNKKMFQEHFDFNGLTYQSTYIPVAATSYKIDCVLIICGDVAVDREEERPLLTMNLTPGSNN